MKKLFFKLGTKILGISLQNRINEKYREGFSEITSFLEELGLDQFEAREIGRNFEKIADNISKSCAEMLTNSSFDTERQKVILEHVLKAYDNANIGEMRIFSENMNIADVEKILLRTNNASDLDPREREFYNRLVNHTSCIIVSTYKNLPEFTSNGIYRLQQQMETIESKIEEIIKSFDNINSSYKDQTTIIDNYNREYRRAILNKYNYINLFGASSLETKLKKYRLSTSYVELELCVEGKNVEDIISPEKMISDNKSTKIWIIGEAGSGKTTLLQWIATTVARSTEIIDGTRGMLPLLIEMRKFTKENISIKKVIENIMENSSYTIPEGWIERNIENGNFLFLVDGFDEVEANERQIFFDLLDEIDDQKKCRRIFTARPTVKERPSGKNVIEYRVLPMNKRKIKQFIEYWHAAVLEEQLEIDHNDSKSISNNLYEKIVNSDSIIRLASYPLLCAMICALHYRNGRNLPSNKREIYEECCKMLFENRDKERNIYIDKNVLSYEKKKILLSELAYWMMRNNCFVITKEQAKGVIERSVAGMGIESKEREEDILNYLLERCGILREPELQMIDFIHRTFQEYLAANQISRNEDWGFLKQKVHDEIWQETIAIAIGYAKKETANELIISTLEEGKKSKKQLFIALKYLSGAIVVDKEIRDDIESKLEKIVPPSFNECHKLATSGDLLSPHLIYKESYTEEQRICCLRTLRLIGTDKSLQIMKTFFAQDLSKDEIREIGLLIDQCEDKILIENDIPQTIVSYINRINPNKVIIHNSFLRPLGLIPENIRIPFESKCVWIMDYFEDELNVFNCFFCNVEKLLINGEFISLDAIDKVESLKKLYLVSENEDYSVYDLNKHKSLYNIQEFHILLNHKEFINGKDLKFLDACKKLSIYLLNWESEFYLEHFNELKSLECLEIVSPYVDEYDYRTSYTIEFEVKRKGLVDCEYMEIMENVSMNWFGAF